MGVLILLCLLLILPAQAEIHGYSKAQGYEYVLLGNYPYEADGTPRPVLWRVLEAENGQALLLTEYVIDAMDVIFETDPSAIENHRFRKISSFAESDLSVWLNSEGLDTLLGDNPIRNALLDEGENGKLFILNSDQFLTEKYGFSKTKWDDQPTRYAVGTPYAVKARGLYVENNGKSPYWSATIRNKAGYQMALVGNNGHISWMAYATKKKQQGIRVSVRLDLSQVEISGGSGTKLVPYTLTYTGALPDPTEAPTETPTEIPTEMPTEAPAAVPTEAPTLEPAPETPAPTAEASQSGAVVSFVGDCSIGDSYQYKKSDTSYHKTIDDHGYDWPFSLVKEYLEGDDLTVANLEVVFTTRTYHSEKLYNLIGDPDHVEALTAGGIDMVNTVNNHCMDFMNTGYVDTLNTLDEAGILHFGTVYPSSPDGHDDLGVADLNGIRFGFIGFSYPQDSDQARIENRIKKLREQGCDVVVVSLHWGRETFMTPEPWQVSYAKQVINAGADVVWGHHPHVIQPIQIYKGKPILYSTGNFTFGTMSKVDPSTGIFQLTYEKVNGQAELTQLRVIPCQTQGSPDYRPMPLTEPEAQKEVFNKLVLKKEYANIQNPPASFLDTGIIRFENGEMLP